MKEIEISQIRRITETIRENHGYDFSNYALSSFRRRIARIIDLHNFEGVDALILKLENEKKYFDEFLSEVTVNVTEMFRDPTFWRVLRDQILPKIKLQEDEPLRIWHAGCSTGEEVFSMAILMRESMHMDNCKIVSSDIDPRVIEQAQSGTYHKKNLEINKKNYEAFNAIGDFEEYYTLKGNAFQMDLSLLENVHFINHNLISGPPVSKFDFVFCRNVLIYFNQALQNEVLKILHGSMKKNGYLSIGSKESLLWCEYISKFETVDNEEKIYRKLKE